jgi:pSer/pThr/pTyr-binding forkhead associated (FHA) protein
VLTVKELERLTLSLKPADFRKQLGPFVLIRRPEKDQQKESVPLGGDANTNPWGEDRTAIARPEAVSAGTLALLFQFDSLEVATLPPMEGIAELTVGRLPDSDLVIEEGSVSKRHAVLHWDPARDKATITDLGSTNGTYLNAGAKLQGESSLHDGDIISFGEVQFWFLLTSTLHTKLRQAKGSSNLRGV